MPRPALRRLTAQTLVVTLMLLGVPVAANASDNEPHPILTLDGQPLLELIHLPRLGVAALGGQVEGRISGTVVNATGQPVAHQRIELRRPTSEGPGRLVTTSVTRCSAQGRSSHVRSLASRTR